MTQHKLRQFQEDSSFVAPMTEVIGKGAAMFGRNVATLQKEGLRFFNERLEDNVKAAEAFGACKTLPDLFAAQQNWLAGTTRAYMEELRRFGELMSDMVRDAGDAGQP